MNKFKQIGSLLLIVLLSLKVLVAPIIYLDYQVRKDYIVKFLCVNRNRPQLHCDGKCYLAKRLAAAEQKEQSEKGQELNRMLFGAEYLHELADFDFATKIFTEKIPQLFDYQLLISKDFTKNLLRPPIQ